MSAPKWLCRRGWSMMQAFLLIFHPADVTAPPWYLGKLLLLLESIFTARRPLLPKTESSINAIIQPFFLIKRMARIFLDPPSWMVTSFYSRLLFGRPCHENSFGMPRWGAMWGASRWKSKGFTPGCVSVHHQLGPFLCCCCCCALCMAGSTVCPSIHLSISLFKLASTHLHLLHLHLKAPLLLLLLLHEVSGF